MLRCDIPDEVLAAEMSVSTKAILGAILCNPGIRKVDLARMLGCDKSSIFRALRQAKSQGLSISFDPRQKGGTSESKGGTSESKGGTSESIQGWVTQKGGTSESKGGTSATPKIDREIDREKKQFLSASGGVPPLPIPTLEEVIATADEMGRRDLAETFFEDCSDRGWIDPKTGDPIRNWKSLLRWMTRNKPRSQSRSQSFTVRPVNRISMEEHLLQIDQNY